MRVGIIGLQHASNPFLSTATELEGFQQDHVLTDEPVRALTEPAHHELGGFLQGLASQRIEAVPVFSAREIPGGVISQDTFERGWPRLLVNRGGEAARGYWPPLGPLLCLRHPDSRAIAATRCWAGGL